MTGSRYSSFIFKQEKQFFRGVQGDSEPQEVFLVPCDDPVTLIRFGTGRHQTVFKVFCLDLKGGDDIIVGHSENLDNVEDIADDPVCVFHAAKGFPRDIEDIRDCGVRNESAYTMVFTKFQDSPGIIKEWISLKQNIQKDIGINHQFHIWKAFLPAGSDGPHQQ